MKTAQIQMVKVALSEMNMTELRQVGDYLNMMYKMQIRKATATFSVGDTVQFTHPKQGTITGTVKKVKPKMVEVVTPSGTNWNVAGTLLKAL